MKGVRPGDTVTARNCRESTVYFIQAPRIPSPYSQRVTLEEVEDQVSICGELGRADEMVGRGAGALRSSLFPRFNCHVRTFRWWCLFVQRPVGTGISPRRGHHGFVS